MKTPLALLLFVTALGTALHGQIQTDFNGSAYPVGKSLDGISDSSLSGASEWNGSNATISEYAKSRSILLKPATSSQNYTATARIKILKGIEFSGTSARRNNLVYVSFDYALESANANYYGTWFRLGGTGYSINQSMWAGIRLSPGTFHFAELNPAGDGNVSTILTGVTYSKIADPGEYIHVSIIIDTEANRYRSLVLSGSKGSADLSSQVKESTLPFNGVSGDPIVNNLTFFTSEITPTDKVPHLVHIDNLYIGNEPKPLKGR